MRKSLLAFLALAMTCLVAGLPAARSAPPSMPAQKRKSLSKDVIAAEAQKYAAAMKEFSAIASMQLKGEADLKKATDVIRKHGGALRLARYKLLQAAIEDADFRAAVEAEVKKAPSKGALEELRRRLRREPGEVMRLGGAQRLKQTLESQIKLDAETLRKVGTKVLEAADAAKRGGAGAPTLSVDMISSMSIPIITVSALLLVEIVIQTPGAAYEVISEETDLTNPDTDSCMEAAQTNCDSCQKSCDGPGRTLQEVACAAECEGKLLLEQARCIGG